MGAIIFSIFLVLIDQSSKFLVVKFLKGQAPLEIINNFLNFYYLENRGAAFGILQEQKLLFTIITLVVLVVLFSILFKNYKKRSFLLKLSLSLIIGGTIGNFIDRIRLGYVIDFISTKIFNYDFAVFNLADAFIVVGTFLLIIMIIVYENPKVKK